jgi:neutral ceramidase
MERAVKVGISSRTIDPQPGALLGGYPEAARAMVGVHDSLMLTAAYISDGVDNDMMLVAIDAVVISPSLVTAARASVGPGCPAVVLASHTHSAPALEVHDWDQGVIGPPDAGYEQWLAVQVQAACKEAVACATVGEIRVGTADLHRAVGSNRRHPGRQGDPRVRVIELQALEPQASLLLAIHGCHPTVLGPDNTWASADLALGLRAAAYAGGYPGAVQLLLGGAGDQSTRSTRRASSFDEAKRIGGILGRAALRALAASQPVEDFAAVSFDVDVPIRLFSEQTAAQRELDGIHAVLGSNHTAGASMAEIRSLRVLELGLQHDVRRAKNPISLGTRSSLGLTAVRLGSQRVLFVPVEPFLGPALELERTARAWLVGYANGYRGYLLPDEEIAIGGYELAASPFGVGAWDVIRTSGVAALETIRG